MPSSDPMVIGAELAEIPPEDPEASGGTEKSEPPKPEDGPIITMKDSRGKERVHWLRRYGGGYKIKIYRCDRDEIQPGFRKIQGKKHDWLRVDMELHGYNTVMRARGLYLFMKSKHLERATQGGYSGLFDNLIGGFTSGQILIGAAIVIIGGAVVLAIWPIMT